MQNILLENFSNKSSNRKPISAISIGSLPANYSVVKRLWFLTYFKRQVAHGNPNDILLITTGGGTEHNGASMNLVEAAKERKKNENSYFCGKSGGILKDLSDVNIIVKSDVASHIQKPYRNFALYLRDFRK